MTIINMVGGGGGEEKLGYGAGYLNYTSSGSGSSNMSNMPLVQLTAKVTASYSYPTVGYVRAKGTTAYRTPVIHENRVGFDTDGSIYSSTYSSYGFYANIDSVTSVVVGVYTSTDSKLHSANWTGYSKYRLDGLWCFVAPGTSNDHPGIYQLTSSGDALATFKAVLTNESGSITFTPETKFPTAFRKVNSNILYVAPVNCTITEL